MQVEISIVIVSYNVSAYLEKCLNSIFRNEKDLSFEIFIVDNNSSDNTIDMLNNKFADQKNLYIIANKDNLGFARANNQVLSKVSGDMILFLNPDTELKEINSLKKLFQYMTIHQNVGICGPRIIFGNGDLQFSCGEKPTLKTTLLEVFLLPKIFPGLFKGYRLANWNHLETRTVDWVSGACLMIRNDVLKTIGGFDDKMIMYAEDVDLCLRTEQLGYEVKYYPDVSIIHYEGQSSRKTRKTAVIAGYKSKLHFFEKYYGLNAARKLKFAFIVSSFFKILYITPVCFFKPERYNPIRESYLVALKEIMNLSI